jgi:hypothetical protein
MWPLNSIAESGLECPYGENTESEDARHQKLVSGKKQRGPASKTGTTAGGNEGSKGQNRRAGTSGSTGKGGPSVGSHKPGGDGPGTKKFKHEHDDFKRRRR